MCAPLCWALYAHVFIVHPHACPSPLQRDRWLQGAGWGEERLSNRTEVINHDKNPQYSENGVTGQESPKVSTRRAQRQSW